MTGDDRLRTELEALERAAPSAEAPRVPDMVRPRWSHFLPVAAPVVAVAIVVGVGLAGLLAPDRRSGPASVTPSPAASTSEVTAEVRNGDFVLTIASSRGSWRDDEAIEVSASLRYDGPQPHRTIWGGAMPILFDVVELTGDRRMTSNRPRMRFCDPVTLLRDEPITQAYVKSVEISSLDPNAAFYEAFRADPEFRLPPGRWQISAWASFPTECRGDALEMYATIEIEVLDRGPLPVPTEAAVPSDGDPASVTGILEGDAHLEGGCIWLRDAAGGRWEVLWPDGYSAEFRGDLPVGGGDVPVIVRGDEVIATAGDIVTVSGHRPPGVGSHCMVGIVFEATEVAVVPPQAAPSGRVCAAAIGHGILGVDAEGNPTLIVEGEQPFRIEWANPGAYRVETEKTLTIFNHYGEILGLEGQGIVLFGGFNEEDMVFHACGISPPPRLDPQ